MSLTFMMVSLINGGNDLIATHFHMSINQIMWMSRIGIFVLPPLAFVITKRICLSLQRADRDLVLHGRETGRLVMLPHGEFVEVHEPISPEKAWTLTSHIQPQALSTATEDANGVAKPKALVNKLRSRMSAANAEQMPAATATEAQELEGGHH